MKWLSGLLGNSVGADGTQNDTQKIEAALAAAQTAIEDNRLSDAIEVLRAAQASCTDATQRRVLFGSLGAPGNPHGIAGLADGCRIRHLDATWALLRFIEEYEGNGKGLCEVWFSAGVRALESGRFDQAQYAFVKCLRSQREFGPDPYRDFRLTPDHFLEAVIKQAVKDLDAGHYEAVLAGLDLLLHFATSSASRAAISETIAQVECLPNGPGSVHEVRDQLYKVLALPRL